MTTRETLLAIGTGFLRGITGGAAILALLVAAELITNGLKWGHL
ncbi:hypothetical protein [Chromobacterium subtsugae]|nr:hypothetical protein [Chromobacterium subtsugae]